MQFQQSNGENGAVFEANNKTRKSKFVLTLPEKEVMQFGGCGVRLSPAAGA
jgi:hypothetical protein